MRWLLLLLTATAPNARGTSCAKVVPCAAIRPNSVIFIGAIVDREPTNVRWQSLLTGATTQVRMVVREVFVGLPEDTKEVDVVIGDWILPGREYLVDAIRDKDGTYSSVICGQSRAVDENHEFLRYLRARKKGQAQTSLTVKVVTMAGITMLPVPGAEVLVGSPKGVRSARTDADGSAEFANLEAGTYSVVASKPHHHLDSRIPASPQVEVLAQTCPSSYVHVLPESTVSGSLRASDGTAIAGVSIELVGVDPEREHRGFSPASYQVKTDDQGEFHFDEVNSGVYVLGTNILYESMSTSQVPRAYFPGRSDRAEAAEILVGDGARVDGLLFVLADAGPRRTVRVRVLDQNGNPVRGAAVADDLYPSGSKGDRFASVGAVLKSEEDGWVRMELFGGARYRIIATDGEPRKDPRVSESTEIAPGHGELTVVLVLRPLK